MAVNTRYVGAGTPAGGTERPTARPGRRPARSRARRSLVVLLVIALVILAISAAGYDALSARLGAGDGGGAGTASTATRATPTATGTAGLEPALKHELDRAITAARADGVELHLTSGWRTWAEQQELFNAAVKKYGSPEAASRWVLPPDKSAHVRGAAVDVGPRSGAKWLERHGSRFGLCRRYDNEWWHFELLVPAGSSACPPREPYAGYDGAAG